MNEFWDKIKVKYVFSIQYMPGYRYKHSYKHTFGEHLLWEHFVSQTKNIPTEHNSVGLWLSFLNVSLHQCTNCGHPGGEATFPAASESCVGAWGQEWDG